MLYSWVKKIIIWLFNQNYNYSIYYNYLNDGAAKLNIANPINPLQKFVCESNVALKRMYVALKIKLKSEEEIMSDHQTQSGEKLGYMGMRIKVFAWIFSNSKI